MPLNQHQISERLRSTPEWRHEENALVRQFTFGSFPDAVAFVVRLAFEAEAADHHPDLRISYRKVTVSWTTHSDGGVTEKDFVGLSQANRLAGFSPAG
jgi:4a-hydroxytetrahydrobiopterin dehydratase